MWTGHIKPARYEVERTLVSAYFYFARNDDVDLTDCGFLTFKVFGNLESFTFYVLGPFDQTLPDTPNGLPQFAEAPPNIPEGLPQFLGVQPEILAKNPKFFEVLPENPDKLGQFAEAPPDFPDKHFSEKWPIPEIPEVFFV